MILLLQLLDWFRFYYFGIGFLCWFGFGFWWALEDLCGFVSVLLYSYSY